MSGDSNSHFLKILLTRQFNCELVKFFLVRVFDELNRILVVEEVAKGEKLVAQLDLAPRNCGIRPDHHLDLLGSSEHWLKLLSTILWVVVRLSAES